MLRLEAGSVRLVPIVAEDARGFFWLPTAVDFDVPRGPGCRVSVSQCPQWGLAGDLSQLVLWYCRCLGDGCRGITPLKWLLGVGAGRAKPLMFLKGQDYNSHDALGRQRMIPLEGKVQGSRWNLL